MDDKPEPPKRIPADGPRIATLASMRGGAGGPGRGPQESDSEEEGQAFYAGGSESSGQQIMGPNRRKVDPNDLVQQIFKAAKEQGAEVVSDPAEAMSAIGAQPRRTLFQGRGHRLHQEEGQEVDMEEAGSSGAQAARPERVMVVIKFWQNGFSVDDGPLRRYDDPASQEFLNSVNKGEIPRELISNARGAEVHVTLEDHKMEEYIPPKAAVKAFQGEGFRLGSPTPDMAAQAAASISTNPEQDEKAAQESVRLDTSRPLTQIQIRLPDGQRLTMKVNTDQTVNRIREYVCTARPPLAATPFLLLNSSSFPQKPITEEDKTIEEAGLKNAVIVVKFSN